MIDCGSLELMQARVLARQGQRAHALAWQRLETAREFSALLDAARQSPLRPWLVGITTPGQPHQIEQVLRAHWTQAVAEVQRWMPLPWTRALQWCALWPLLPALQHLARGGAVWPWMHQDPDLRALVDAPAPQREARLAAGALQALARAWAEPERMARAWHDEWQRRLPRGAMHPEQGLPQLAALLRSHGQAFATAPAAQGGLLRGDLHGRLQRLLHRVGGGAALAFIHLALVALELERLRGELLGRALFAAPPAARVH